MPRNEVKYHSQWEQDRWVNENLFHDQHRGVFIDVGAHDGVTGSNTLFFEKELEWSGLCIEPNPEVFERLSQNRSSVLVNCCAYDTDGTVVFSKNRGYTQMLRGVVQDYNPAHLQRIAQEQKVKGGETQFIMVPSLRLDTLFERHGIERVNYMTVDTEGSELKVLQGVDFERVRVDVIDVEINYEDERKPIHNFLISKRFVEVARLGGDSIYINMDLIPPPKEAEP